jgi:hypothetical protein
MNFENYVELADKIINFLENIKIAPREEDIVIDSRSTNLTGNSSFDKTI